MRCVTIFVIFVVWFLLPRVARLMIHTPTAISIFVCMSMVQLMAVFVSFFFQAEDGIRDRDVTGVQTCALPILAYPSRYVALSRGISQALVNTAAGLAIGIPAMMFYAFFRGRAQKLISDLEAATTHEIGRARVGKECNSRSAPNDEIKKQ